MPTGSTGSDSHAFGTQGMSSTRNSLQHTATHCNTLVACDANRVNRQRQSRCRNGCTQWMSSIRQWWLRAPTNRSMSLILTSLLRLACMHTNTGWRRCRGCLKFQVSFHKRATDYRALLRKVTYKGKASYDSMPPYTSRFAMFFCGY